MTTTSELRPCPFCGSNKVDVGATMVENESGECEAHATCFGCLCHGPVVWRKEACAARNDAEKAWNENQEKKPTSWLAENYPSLAVGMMVAAIVIAVSFVVGYNSAAPKSTGIATPTPRETIPYLGMAGGDNPFPSPEASLTPYEYAMAPGAAPQVAAPALAATEAPDYRYPTWWAMTDAQRRLSLSTAYTKLNGGGGKLLGLDALETSRLYAIAQTWNFGHAESNPFDVCASGGCWTCQAYKGAVVCEDASRRISVIEWDGGPLFGGKLTPMPAPTLGVPVMPTKAK